MIISRPVETKMPKPFKLDKSGRLKLRESDVVQQVSDFLQCHGWREYPTGYGEVRRGERVVATVGEEGMADRQYIRYGAGHYAEVLWVEYKRPKSAGDSGGRLRKVQREWIAGERLRGATCLVVDSLVEFQKWYRKEIGTR